LALVPTRAKDKQKLCGQRHTAAEEAAEVPGSQGNKRAKCQTPNVAHGVAA